MARAHPARAADGLGLFLHDGYRLRRAMETGKLTVYEVEGKHFDLDDWRDHRIQDSSFDRIGG